MTVFNVSKQYDAALLEEANYRKDLIPTEEIEDDLDATFDYFHVIDETKVDGTANLFSIETDLIQTVNVRYEGQLEWNAVWNIQQMTLGDMEFDDEYKTLKGNYKIRP